MKCKGTGEKSELRGDTMSTHRLRSEFPSPVVEVIKEGPGFGHNPLLKVHSSWGGEEVMLMRLGSRYCLSISCGKKGFTERTGFFIVMETLHGILLLCVHRRGT